jgi:hypothetical protein
MSLGAYIGNDPGGARNMRRAIVLIGSAMQTETLQVYKPRYRNAAAVPAGHAANLLVHLIRKARVVATTGTIPPSTC